MSLLDFLELVTARTGVEGLLEAPGDPEPPLTLAVLEAFRLYGSLCWAPWSPCLLYTSDAADDM
eukprot:7754807-Alexandrium_andersonii.AAC.1